MSQQTASGKYSPSDRGITRITVAGFKSIADEQSMEVRPLTILAGANSSGKSSMMQPLLLLKQTIEAHHDAGPLLIDGPNVKFTSFSQFEPRVRRNAGPSMMSVSLEWSGLDSLTLRFSFPESAGANMQISEMIDEREGRRVGLRPGMSHAEMLSGDPVLAENYQHFWENSGRSFVVVRDRCFLARKLREKGRDEAKDKPDEGGTFSLGQQMVEWLTGGLMHLPGLRGNPERTYPVAAIGPGSATYAGTFDKYAASILAHWEGDSNFSKLGAFQKDLERLGLARKVKTRRVDDTRLELLVNRLVRPGKDGADDLVSIADVGFGVSQALPVIVALHAAIPGEAVYVEQPETHLHPRAQTAMAEVLADAANRGVRIVAETHSALLLLGVQALVADGKLDREKVKLHWFTRSKEDGSTKIDSADLDSAGRFGDWPEDFGKAELEAQSRYLNASESAQMKG